MGGGSGLIMPESVATAASVEVGGAGAGDGLVDLGGALGLSTGADRPIEAAGAGGGDTNALRTVPEVRSRKGVLLVAAAAAEEAEAEAEAEVVAAVAEAEVCACNTARCTTSEGSALRWRSSSSDTSDCQSSSKPSLTHPKKQSRALSNSPNERLACASKCRPRT